MKSNLCCKSVLSNDFISKSVQTEAGTVVRNHSISPEHVELLVWLHNERLDIEQIRALNPWLKRLDWENGYNNRRSLQTYHYLFDEQHLRF